MASPHRLNSRLQLEKSTGILEKSHFRPCVGHDDAMNQAAEDLLTAAVSRDLDALNQLLRLYGPSVRDGLHIRIDKCCQSVLDLDDVMQVTYLEAFLRIDQLRTPQVNAFISWLRQIAENNLRDATRELNREKRPPPGRRIERAAVTDEDSCVMLLDLLGAESTTPSRSAQAREVCALVRVAVGKLPADYARVVTLYDLEGKIAGDVARTMGRSEGAVYMLRARAHDRLRELLGAESNYFSDSA
jgi:RNA polymerase sigma-70 factor, ECF subfamily